MGLKGICWPAKDSRRKGNIFVLVTALWQGCDRIENESHISNSASVVPAGGCLARPAFRGRKLDVRAFSTECLGQIRYPRMASSTSMGR